MIMNKIVIYDFDGTLTPYPITKLGILEKCGYVGGGMNKEFHKKVYTRRINKNISVYNSFYETIFEIIKSSGFPLKDECFSTGAEGIEYNNGVYEFIKYLNENGVLNYMLSSTMKVFLEKTDIAQFFSEIYATTFKYDDKEEAIGIDNLVSDDKKVEVVKDIIIKNNLTDCSSVIYIGDGLTDIPAMEYINSCGGTTIYVYDDEEDLVEINKRDIVSFYFKKDFSLDSELSNKVRDILNIESVRKYILTEE